MTNGKLIAVCGIDGCGKSTQIARLAAWLRAYSLEVIETRQPSDFYRNHPQVRAYLDEGDRSLGMAGIALLAAADRQHHVRAVIEPAVAAGRWVISDRYVYSTYAFFMARGLDLPWLRTINRGVPLPDLTVLLDLPPAVARARVEARDGKVLKYEERSLDFMEQVRRNFLANRDESFLIIDATQPADAIAEAIAVRLLPWQNHS